MQFLVGDFVEVCSTEDGFRGSYFSAKILSIHSNGTFQVQYQNLVDDDETTPLIETVRTDELRPLPLYHRVSHFNLLDRVDAYDLDGWWVGTVMRVKSNDIYCVRFDSSEDGYEYPFSRLRIHMEFQDGNWIISRHMGH